jgi:DNA-directed RNA polymerase specialized sigma24 family protein
MTAAPTTADSDLARSAAAGDAGAFAALYHRHVEAAWRLAQAATSSADAARQATVGGFAIALGLVSRGREDVADEFSPHLLAAVYRGARVDPSPSMSRRRPSRDRDKRTPDAAGPLVVAAFAALPARWRAALWLADVERLPMATVGTILGVPSGIALQLLKRGRASLEQRVAQAGGSLPYPDLAAALSATVSPPPSQLFAATESRWNRAVTRDRRARPAGWLTERAPAPLAASILGLCAAGIIAMAIVGSGSNATRLPAAGPTRSTTPAGAPSGSLSLGGGTNPGGTSSTTTATTTPTSSEAVATPTTTPAPPATLVISQPAAAPIEVTVPTTVVITVPTVPVTTTTTFTLPPVTLPPITVPPVTTTTTTTPPMAAATPLVQVSANASPLLVVNVGLGDGGCTGVGLLGLKLGCTTAPPGITLGGSLLGGL